ncbi:MAG: hypothetical protein JWR69_430 [Pedosphaera sp.]|nr:hypothetical protein [Pedosphaera sp.]
MPRSEISLGRRRLRQLERLEIRGNKTAPGALTVRVLNARLEAAFTGTLEARRYEEQKRQATAGNIVAEISACVPELVRLSSIALWLN